MDANQRQLTALEPLELRHLPDDGLTFDEALPQTWLAEAVGAGSSGLMFVAVEPGRLKIEVMPLGPVDERPPIRIRGRLDAVLETDCVRCLATVRPSIEGDLDITLIAGPPARAENESGRGTGKVRDDARLDDWSSEDFPNPDELADAVYRGETVDLPDILREALLLGLATDPVCEDTVGCDARTAALIDEANAPVRQAEDGIDPRWAALRKLRESS